MKDLTGLRKGAFAWFGLHAEALDGDRMDNLTLRRQDDGSLVIRAAIEHENIRRYFVGEGDFLETAAMDWLQKVYKYHQLDETTIKVLPDRK